MDSAHLAELIEASDLDGLVRFIDGVCTSRDWEGLVTVRDRCLEAVTRGKQLWGVAEFANYRLALEAPPELAGTVVIDGAGRASLGPLWEVAASTHTYAELAPHIASDVQRVLVAHERSLRGEVIDESRGDRKVIDVPVAVQPWEPEYPAAVYRSDRADFPEMELPVPQWQELGEPGRVIDDDESCEALLELVRPWTDESDGRAEAIAVEGGAGAAIAALGPRRARLVRLDGSTALGVMTWSAASGGAYGRRRGNAVGRSLAWHAVATLAEIPWPASSDDVATALRSMTWWRWDPGDQVGGWALYLAVELPSEGLAWAVSAVDSR